MGADAKRKEDRKRKFGPLANGVPTTTKATINKIEPVAEEPPKKKRKGRKELRGSINSIDPEDPAIATSEAGDTTVSRGVGGQVLDTATQKAQRFIVFIGNLPYTATDKTIGKHFAKVQPNSIRHCTEKEGGKSKGFAFLEFEGYDRMKTCLKLYHGSSFDDGTSLTRKLNVELTAGGGGGKSTDRKNKLQSKNKRLSEQRARRAQEEQKQNGRSKNLEHRKQEKGRNGTEKERQRAKPQEPVRADAASSSGDIHPTRRSRVTVST